MENKIFRKSIKANTFALLLILFQVIGGSVVSSLLKPVIVSLGGGLGALLVSAQIILLIMPVTIYFLITKENVKEVLRLNKPYLSEIGFCIIIGVLAQVVAIFCANLSSFIFPKNEVEQVFDVLKKNSYISLISIIALTPAICEELVVRGVILHNYNNKNIWKACAMSGVIFGMLHLTGSQFLYATLLGVLLAYLVRVTNSIFTSMTVHFVFNGFNATLAYIISKFDVMSKALEEASASKETLTLTKRVQALGGTFVLALVATSIIITILISIKNKREKLRVNEFRVVEVEEKDNMINIPFIILVIFYIFYMWLNYF